MSAPPRGRNAPTHRFEADRNVRPTTVGLELTRKKSYTHPIAGGYQSYRAAPRAENIARAFTSVSSYSASAWESATIPPPTEM